MEILGEKLWAFLREPETAAIIFAHSSDALMCMDW